MCFFARCIYGMNIYIYTHPSLYIHARIHTNLFIHLHVHNILGIVVKKCLNELRVEVAIERKVARQNKAKSGRKGVKKRDMKLPPQKLMPIAPRISLVMRRTDSYTLENIHLRFFCNLSH